MHISRDHNPTTDRFSRGEEGYAETTLLGLGALTAVALSVVSVMGLANSMNQVSAQERERAEAKVEVQELLAQGVLSTTDARSYTMNPNMWVNLDADRKEFYRQAAASKSASAEPTLDTANFPKVADVPASE